MIRLTFFILLLLTAARGIAQNTPVLERRVTLAVNAERIDKVLRNISEQAGFVFSYSPSAIDVSGTVTLSFVNQTVREVLDVLFEGRVEYRARGKYLILTRAARASAEESKVTGYVVDEATGERLKNVTIYDPISLTSTLTDSYGYFELKVDKPAPDLKLVVNKLNYSDTLVTQPSRNGRLLTIQMKNTTGRIATFADSVGSKIGRFWRRKVLLKQMTTMANVSDTLYRKAQVSFVPFIGTNHALSGNVINDLSFNVIGGYSLGVRKFELGGVFNTVRGDVEGAQVAGVFNGVAGNVKGFEMAGVFNAVGGRAHGAHVGGVFNFFLQEHTGFSCAGVFNFAAKSSSAIQVAGVLNFTADGQSKPQLAGVLNFVGKDSKTQVAGSVNFTGGNLTGWQGAGSTNFVGKDIRGAQTAGVLNFAGGNVSGAQVAGVVNVAGKSVHGAQVGLVNVASRVRGAQVGLINVTDSIGGVPIGLLSIVGKGYHKIELSADEIFLTNVAFRTGVRQFYNILAVGMKPNTASDSSTHWSFGYGLGTAPRLARKVFLNFDLSSNQVVQGNRIESLNLLNKLYVGLDWQLHRHFSITAGATLNAYITESDYGDYWSLFDGYTPSFIHEETTTSHTVQMWIGGKIGIRFL